MSVRSYIDWVAQYVIWQVRNAFHWWQQKLSCHILPPVPQLNNPTIINSKVKFEELWDNLDDINILIVSIIIDHHRSQNQDISSIGLTTWDLRTNATISVSWHVDGTTPRSQDNFRFGLRKSVGKEEIGDCLKERLALYSVQYSKVFVFTYGVFSLNVLDEMCGKWQLHPIIVDLQAVQMVLTEASSAIPISEYLSASFTKSASIMEKRDSGDDAYYIMDSVQAMVVVANNTLRWRRDA
ncbi:hypothetical protein PGQ11_012744 [Apiospora arundinis]|uniref:Uncharacterized protein n=1 Tax=Apiospora arundinis TaxID=335852 RepID=A0ABR2I485_9PEZI